MTQDEAHDTILEVLNKAVIDPNVSKLWPDKPEDAFKDKPRILVSFEQFVSDHTLGEPGHRFYQRDEVLVVMVKSPIRNTAGPNPKDLANTIKNLFEGKHLGEVWFRDCISRSFGQIETDVVYGVRCEFHYQEQK